MGFLEEVDARMPQKGPRCRTCIALDQLDAKTRAEIDAVLANPAKYSTAIRAALIDRNLDVGSVDTVRRHRAGECKVGVS